MDVGSVCTGAPATGDFEHRQPAGAPVPFYAALTVQPRSDPKSPQWGEIFDDTVVAAAMLDRLMHRSIIIAIDGESYRMRAHQHATDLLRTGLATTERD